MINGGAIASFGTIARLDNVVFEGNTATQRGGAISLYGTGSSLGNVTGCTFRGNRALNAGAGIYMENSHLTSMSITTTTFVDNKCDDLENSFGGAIFFFAVTSNIVVVKDSHFLNNWAMYGGAVRLDNLRSLVSSFPLLSSRIMLALMLEALSMYTTPPSTSSTTALLCATGLTLPLLLQNYINVSLLFFIFFDLKLCCGSGCDCCPQFA